MRIFDTLSQKKIALKKSRKRLNFFVCGPTVYDHSHIGHARTYIVFDTFAKYLRHKGFNIFYLQNITDIDDKIIARAKEKRVAPQTLARSFEKSYLEDSKALKITSVDKYARASEHIVEIQKQIKLLLKKGFAYRTENGVYFEVKKCKEYGKLSKQNLNELRPGYRIEPDPQKRDSLDFALWKISSNAHLPKIKGRSLKVVGSEPLWPSPWGWGRPGWHIEDTAITQKYFGSQYDIHGGGADLKFPHHEAEIAQQESASGKKPFVKIWMHTGFLLVYGEKMSKSLGNFVTIKDFIKPHGKAEGSNIFRWIVMSSHYRSPLDYTPESVRQAKNSLETILEFLEKIRFSGEKSAAGTGGGIKVPALIRNFEKTFYRAMDDDFNTPLAVAAIFDFIASLQKKMWLLSKSQTRQIEAALSRKLAIFEISSKNDKIPPKISKLALLREKMRASKQFIPADALRNEIDRLGYKVEDTPLGPFIRKVK